MKIIIPFFLILSTFSCQSGAQQAKQQKPTKQPATQTQTQTQTQVEKPFTDVNVEEAARLIKEEGVVILDVRTPEETAQGKIEGAVEMNLYDPDFAKKIGELEKDKTYLVYCRSGRRSVTASNEMAKQGFKKIYNLLGGYNAWKARYGGSNK
ncbi:MAG TPA: rhodanese-like domain-containing protein [Bacteroidetes bacterium]|nr:rhodanese-like domain-containing protein [Bacteroidota bacterium]